MEVVDPRSALLSNYEVLNLLRELENTHLERSKAAIRIKKEEEAAGAPHTHTNPLPDISENIRTIQVEAIQYLSSPFLPSQSQSPAGITKLIKELAPYDLTKAEKLQIVNLAPTTPVELYVIVEELEDRLGDSMDTILETVKSTLSTPASAVATTTTSTTSTIAATNGNTPQVNGRTDKTPLFLSGEGPSSGLGWDDADADAIIDDDVEFVDHDGDAGFGDDLDVEDNE